MVWRVGNQPAVVVALDLVDLHAVGEMQIQPVGAELDLAVRVVAGRRGPADDFGLANIALVQRSPPTCRLP